MLSQLKLDALNVAIAYMAYFNAYREIHVNNLTHQTNTITWVY